MKNLRLLYLFGFVLILAGSSCSRKATPVVATDKDLEQGEFDRYKTFTFADHINDASNDLFFWDNELMKLEMKDEVKGELEALGYRYVEGSDADLLVNFRIFRDDAEFLGWTDNYADENYWGPMEMRKEAIGLEPSAQVREPGDAKTYYFEKGTILIQMVDMKKSIPVWQGYATGIVKNASFLDGDDVKVDEAVEKIFDKYNFEAPD